MGTVRNDKSPTISDASLSAIISAAFGTKHGLIYGGQIGDKTTAGTITMGTEAAPIKVASSSTLLGTAVSSQTRLVGFMYESPASPVKSNVEFVGTLPTDSGSTTSAFQPASNWTGTWN